MHRRSSCVTSLLQPSMPRPARPYSRSSRRRPSFPTVPSSSSRTIREFFASPTALWPWRTGGSGRCSPRLLVNWWRSPDMPHRFFSATRHGIPLLALAMLGFGGWSVASKYQPRVVTSPPIAAPTSPYDDDVAGSGIIEPASEVIALATERGGVVTRIAVVAGDFVKPAQPPFSIDDRNSRAPVAQDEATVASTPASLAVIDQSLVLQGETIDQARANLQGVEAERTRAALDLTRYAHLVQDAWVTHQRFETATADAEKATASVAAAKAALASAQQQKQVLLAQRKN